MQVILDGGGLLGDPLLMLGVSLLSTPQTWTDLQHDGPNHLCLWFKNQARETRTYQLIYSPLVSGPESGGVSFVNERVGKTHGLYTRHDGSNHLGL